MAKLPILMYHNIAETESNGLTISATKIEEQFKYLANKNFRSYHFSELNDYSKLPGKRNVVITFDDGFLSQLEFAVPLLKKYNLKATFFIPLAYLGKNDAWHTKSLPIMTSEILKTLDRSVIELAYHSYHHKKYHELNISEIKEDTRLSIETVSKNELSFSPAIAYPYGKFPKAKFLKQKFVNHLEQKGFKYGLRIGNRLNKFPFKNKFEIQRIDIKGEYSFKKFKQKLRWGKFF
ncbi:polysaccharide deacetylase [Patiriisocius marinistellae]|uniref:Polysaccharide deacetylase n=1 Tax=Patiriisocius marinistellae TaxID=2494560 RepID=A0A5J4G025_9FLAO|nr:polysaccharide deacetylase family protein [Patiriisocius marinistellae]GEQ85839.1 polysaccharide deacetylase [Patiriisocius marinistellae]